MSFEIGAAHVSIYPKISGGFGRQIKNAFSGADTAGAAAGKQAGSSFVSHLKAILVGAGITKAVSSIGSTLKGAFKGGFDRLMNIEQAQIKLKTLGVDVNAAMASVNDAVDGTKFAISDAADMAAFLGASGVAAGQDMTKWLSRTADAAQFTNRPFGEMQQLMGEVVASGRITGETLNRLPLAAAALADHLGVSQEEVRKLASQGKISAEQFGEAMDKKIGGAAKNAGESFLSLRDNMKTALNATTAALIEPITKAAMPIMKAGLGLLKSFRDGVAKPLGSALGTWLQPKAEALGRAIEKLPETFSRLRASLAGGGDVASGLLGGLAKAAEGLRPLLRGMGDAWRGFVDGFGGLDSVLSTAANLLPLLTGPLGVLKTALLDVFGAGGVRVDMQTFGRAVGQTLKPLLEGVIQVAGAIAGALADALAAILPAIIDLGATLGPLITQLASELAPVLADAVASALTIVGDLIAALAPVVGELVAALGPLIAALVETLAPVIGELARSVLPPLLDALSGLGDLVATVIAPKIAELARIFRDLTPIIEGLAPVVRSVFTAIGNVIAGALRIISGVIRVVTGVIKGDWSAVWEGVKQIFAGAWQAIIGLVNNAANIVKFVIAAALNVVKNIFSGAWNAIVGLVGGVPGRILGALAGLGQLPGRAAQWVGGFAASARAKFTDAITFAGGVPGRILGALGNLGGRFVASGRALIDGFVRGIRRGFDNALGAVKNGLDRIRSFFPFSPAKEGPFSGRGYTTYSGQALMRDFAAAIHGEQDAVRSAIDQVMSDASGQLSATIGVNGQSAAAPTQRPGGLVIQGPLVHIASMSVRSDADVRDLSRQLQDGIDAKLRALGAAPALGGA